MPKIRRPKPQMPLATIEEHASPSFGEFTCVAAARVDIGATANLVIGGQPRKRPQRQNKRWREAQLLPVLFEAYPDWRNGIPSKAELDPRRYLVKCRRAVWKNPDTRNLLSSVIGPPPGQDLQTTFRRPLVCG